MDSLLLPLAIVGVVLALITIMTVFILPSKDSRRTRELTEMVTTYVREHPDAQTNSGSALKSMAERSTQGTAALLQKHGWYERLGSGLAAAGMRFKPEEYLLITAGSGLVGGLVLFFLTKGTLAVSLFGFLIGIAVPVLIVRMKINRREARFVADLPDMLTALASSLSAGSSLPQALDSVAQETSGPMQEELTRTLVNSRLGIPIPDSLEETAQRLHCTDLELVVMAMRLQSIHGGNLSEILNVVSATLRERVQMKRHVNALSAEGRLSVMVLIAVPIGALLMIAIIQPAYFTFFFSEVAGIVMITGSALMLTIGYFWARSIAKVEV